MPAESSIIELGQGDELKFLSPARETREIQPHLLGGLILVDRVAGFYIWLERVLRPRENVETNK